MAHLLAIVRTAALELVQLLGLLLLLLVGVVQLLVVGGVVGIVVALVMLLVLLLLLQVMWWSVATVVITTAAVTETRHCGRGRGLGVGGPDAVVVVATAERCVSMLVRRRTGVPCHYTGLAHLVVGVVVVAAPWHSSCPVDQLGHHMIRVTGIAQSFLRTVPDSLAVL